MTRPRTSAIATLAMIASLAGLTTSSLASRAAADHRLDPAARRVWPVALMGLAKFQSRFSRIPGSFGVVDPATAIEADGGAAPSVYAKNGLLYLWYRASTPPILVIDRSGIVVRSVVARHGVNSLAVDNAGNLYVTPPVDWLVERID